VAFPLQRAPLAGLPGTLSAEHEHEDRGASLALRYAATMSEMGRTGSRGSFPEAEPCNVCGGDGRIDNAWGQTARCPSCGGSGRRRVDTGFRDVTKTKESHHQGTNRAPVAEKQTWPTTPAGIQLATQIRDAAALTAETKQRLTREIIDHEASHGQCTKTFVKKVRKQTGLLAPR
jgi:hypothetical protein